MEFKRFEGIDYEFRPKSYWDTFDDPLQAILKNVKGTNRRQMIRDYWEAGRIEELFDTHLLDELGKKTGVVSARFILHSWAANTCRTTRKVRWKLPASNWNPRRQMLSAFVRRKRASESHILIVDEYETEFNILPTHSDKPLTLSELVGLIDGATEEGSLGLYYTQMNYEGGERSIEWLDQMRHFTRVESVFYPQLNLHYEKLLDLWYEEEKAKLIGD